MDLLRTVGFTLMGGGVLIGVVTLTIWLPGKVIDLRRKSAAEHPPASDGQPFLPDAEVDPDLRVPIGKAAPQEPTPLACAAFDAVPWSAEGVAGAQLEVWVPWGYEAPEFDESWRRTTKEMKWTATPHAASVPAQTTARLAATAA